MDHFSLATKCSDSAVPDQLSQHYSLHTCPQNSEAIDLSLPLEEDGLSLLSLIRSSLDFCEVPNCEPEPQLRKEIEFYEGIKVSLKDFYQKVHFLKIL